MEKIAIISDCNAGLDYVKGGERIPVLRSVINFGDEHYVDGTDIKADEFYKKLKEVDIIPSTSAPTIGEAMTLIESLIEKEYTDVIMYAISYNLSSIGQMVESLRSEYPQINIHVVDTKMATYMQGFLAMEAKKMVDEGYSVKDILERTNYLLENSHAYFIVDDLRYLVKNGRLSGAQGFLGGLLKIKPVLELTKDGRIVSKEKVKTFRRAVERGLELFLDEIGNHQKLKVLVLHTDRLDDAKKIAKSIRERLSDRDLDVEISTITPAVGAHIGCGVLGFGYFKL